MADNEEVGCAGRIPDGMSLDEMKQNLRQLQRQYLAMKLLDRYRFNLHEIAHILSDKNHPIPYTTLRAWTTGKTLSLSPSMRVDGFTRPQWGFPDLVKFMIAKQLLGGGFGRGSFRASAVQQVIDLIQNGKLFDGLVDYVKYTTILVFSSPNDPQELQIKLFKDDDHTTFSATIESVIKTHSTFNLISIESTLDQLMHRLMLWVDGETYDPNPAGAAERLKEAFRSAAFLRAEVESAKEALKV
jgi:hypothetical protein